jgi:hypothetical protein
MSTWVAPKFEKLDSPPVLVIDATAITESYEAADSPGDACVES